MGAREGRVFDRLTSEAQAVVQGARLAARRLRHGRVGEHHWRRTPKGYSWSIGTQGLNALLAAFRLFTTPGSSTLVTAIIGFQLAVHTLGWIATRAAKHEFQPR